MAERLIAGRAPSVQNLQPGTYFWCACGRSKSQPFCDGSHAGTGFSPLPFSLTAPQRCALCACKHSHTQPFCDGTHKTLPPA